MEESEIRKRIERAHRKAAYELKDYLEELMIQEPEWDKSRSFYCSSFIDEVYINEQGIKDYDREVLGQLMPQVIKEFSSNAFKIRVEEVLRSHKQSVMNKEILVCSAKAILTSKFSEKEIAPFSVYAYSETKVCVSRITLDTDLSVIADITSLIKKVEKASRITDIFNDENKKSSYMHKKDVTTKARKR